MYSSKDLSYIWLKNDLKKVLALHVPVHLLLPSLFPRQGEPGPRGHSGQSGAPGPLVTHRDFIYMELFFI